MPCLIGATSQEPIESSRTQCVVHGNARQKKEVFDQDARQSCGDSSILSLKQCHLLDLVESGASLACEEFFHFISHP